MIVKIEHEGVRWTVNKLWKHSVKSRGRDWAKAQIKLVDRGEKLMDTVLKESQVLPKTKRIFFIGKTGKKYTTDLVMRETAKLGKPLQYEGAWNRISRAKKGTLSEEKILDISRQATRIETPISEELTPEQFKTMQDFKKVYYGEMSYHDL